MSGGFAVQPGKPVALSTPVGSGSPPHGASDDRCLCRRRRTGRFPRRHPLRRGLPVRECVQPVDRGPELCHDLGEEAVHPSAFRYSVPLSCAVLMTRRVNCTSRHGLGDGFAGLFRLGRRLSWRDASTSPAVSSRAVPISLRVVLPWSSSRFASSRVALTSPMLTGQPRTLMYCRAASVLP